MNERELFERAIEFSDRRKRDAFLDKACGADVALRQRLAELLAAHDQASGFLVSPVVVQLPPKDDDGTQPTLEIPAGQNGSEKTPPPAPVERSGPSDDQDGDDEADDGRDAVDLSFLSPPTHPGSLGRLGHYDLLKILGRGAFGVVFKAFDQKLHRYVAIKTMSPQLAATSPPRKRFLREARAVAALKHENVVQIYAVEEQPLPYLAMEYVDGRTLQQKLDGAGPLEVSEVLHLGRQMAAGLAAAHEKGLIHRDIKPGNILLESGAEQRVKISDFGLARAADDATMTRSGVIAGTPMYMAPEQALGRTLDPRADLFSLGSVLYQMTCGRPPFRGANALAVLKRVIDEEPRSIQDVLPEVPDWLCAIVAKLHAKNPAERFQSAREVADLLARCQNEWQATGHVTAIVPEVAQASVHGNAEMSAAPRSGDRSPSSSSSATHLRWAALAVATTSLSLLAVVATTELTGLSSFVPRPRPDAAVGPAISSPAFASPTIVVSPPTVVPPTTREGSKTYLYDLQELDVEVLDGRFREGFDPRGVTIKGKHYPKGLWMHPFQNRAARAKFRSADFPSAEFISTVALDDSAKDGSASPVVFELFGDGKLLWKSEPFQMRFQSQNCRVRIDRIQELELQVTCGDDYRSCVGVWGDPHFLVKGDEGSRE